MTARRIDGKKIAAEIHGEVRERARRLSDRGIRPALATVLVGNDPASTSYVRAKLRACEEDGIRSFHHHLPPDSSEHDLLDLIAGLGADAAVHGILVQLPLPPGIDERSAIASIPVDKDVDGFSLATLGRLGLKQEEVPFAPCTPLGILEMLDRSDVEIGGRRAVVLGRSRIVGLPMAMLLLSRDATVTICHSRTPDLGGVTREADILVAAIGRAGLVQADMVKPGAVVIDVGVNRIEDPLRKRGYRLVGDCDYEGVSEVASAITPVPGGVGPMTIAMLLSNTVLAAERATLDQR